MFSADLINEATDLLERARQNHLTLVTAESCTGGLIAACLTEIAGASDVVDCGFVTYSNAAKNRMLGVSLELISEYGAVSEPVARAMAEGALEHSGADISIAVTGIAGPGGGTKLKPVGLVHMAAAKRGQKTLHQKHLFGDIGRTAIRLATVAQAFKLINQLI
jgi:nicotinamide-nucleotide amidase